MKNLFLFAIGMAVLASCSGKDPVYWFEAESPDGGTGSNIPYYPAKPSGGGDAPEEPKDGYAPAGYRMIKHILVPLTSEDTTAMTEKETALSAAQTALTNAQTALDEAAEDADKTALQTALDEAKKAAEEAQAAYNEAKDAAFAAIKGKADEIYEKAIAEDADFDALIAEYSTDNMPADGYAVREGGTTFVEPFTNAAMALANVGDVSEPVETTYGYHILKYVSDVEEGPVSFDSVRDTIASSLLSSKQSETITATRAQYVSEANVKTYEDRMD